MQRNDKMPFEGIKGFGEIRYALGLATRIASRKTDHTPSMTHDKSAQ